MPDKNNENGYTNGNRQNDLLCESNMTYRRVRNVGMIAKRLAGMDGVSLEAAKWVHVLEGEGLNCFFLGGELDRPGEKSMEVPLAHFKHPEIVAINKECYGKCTRKPSITKKIHEIKDKLKEDIYKFIRKFKIDLLIPENAITIPLNIPFGLAITEVIAETAIPTIAHHHDFYWERQRFLTNSVWDYLNMAFPPHLPSIHHVVINSAADKQLSLRTGASSTIIPNVMDFENPPDPPDEYARDVRETLGIADDELFVLQPTRVVRRKGIEHAIEFVLRLKQKAKLVISHASGDEGNEYEQRVREYSKLMGVDTLFVSDCINEKRGSTKTGKKIYTLYDIYPHCDLVTYPSEFEGFGNAFLEAIYFKKPIVVNRYTIYSTDIKPKGFKVVELDGYVTPKALNQTRHILSDDVIREKIVNDNYELGRRYYSYSILREKLRNLIHHGPGA